MQHVDPVAWLEGAYVSPQHFQQQERYLTNYASRLFHIQHPDEFGFTRLEISTDMLNTGKLVIRCAEGIFPDMTPFSLNRQLIIDIPNNYNNEYVYLVMVLGQSGEQEVGSKSESGTLYRYTIDSEDIIDNTNPNNPSVKVPVARPQLKMMLGGRDLSHYAYLHVAKVNIVDDNGRIELDHKFIPPILNIHLSSHLNLWLQDYHSRLTQRATIMERQLLAGRGYKSPQALFQDQLWIAFIRQWIAQIGCAITFQNVSPRYLYSCLQSVAGAMSGLILKTPPEPKELNPFKLLDSFAPILNYLSDALQDSGSEWVSELPPIDSQFSSTGLLEYDIPATLDDFRLIIAIPEKAAVSLSNSVEFYLTLAPSTLIKELVQGAETGIPLTIPPIPPSELSISHHIFLEPDQTFPLFTQMLQENRRLALHVDDQLGSPAIHVYLIRHL